MPKRSTKTVPVSEPALVARINRRLVAEGRTLRRCPLSSRWINDLGDYYTVDVNTASITAKHVDPERWARELGCLRPWEHMVE